MPINDFYDTTPFDRCVLAVLVERPHSSTEIREELTRQIGSRPGENSVVRSLRRMRNRGLVVSDGLQWRIAGTMVVRRK